MVIANLRIEARRYVGNSELSVLGEPWSFAYDRCRLRIAGIQFNAELWVGVFLGRELSP